MAEKAEVQSRKSVKKKVWYPLLSPISFGSREIAQSVASKPEELEGRVLEMPLSELTGNMKHFSTKVYLKVAGKSTEKSGLATRYVGQEMMRDQVERSVRRWSSRIDAVQDITLKDGTKMRVKSLIITGRRSDTSVKAQIRAIVFKQIEDAFKSRTLDEIVKDINDGKIQKSIESQSKKVFPIRSVNIRKTEVMN